MDVDDILVLMLERIDSPVSLIGAASTCRRRRRVIAGAGFLHRYRSLHRPTVSGDYYNNCYREKDGTGGRPSFVPSSSIVDARHFSVDFVVDASIFKPCGWESMLAWEVSDSRGCLLLMECIHEPHICSAGFPELVVCEPLTRRYRIIPRPPDFKHPDWIFRRAYLVDGGDEDETGGRIGMSYFRVQCILLSCEDGLAHTLMYTVGSGDMDSTWSEKAIDHIAFRTVQLSSAISWYLGRVLGSYFFYVKEDGTLITRDGSTGKFSSSVLSLHIIWDDYKWKQNFSVVDGGDGEPRIVTVTSCNLEVFARRNGEWGLEKKVPLSKVTRGLPGYQPSFFFDGRLTIIRGGVGLVVI